MVASKKQNGCIFCGKKIDRNYEGAFYILKGRLVCSDCYKKLKNEEGMKDVAAEAKKVIPKDSKPEIKEPVKEKDDKQATATDADAGDKAEQEEEEWEFSI